MNPIILPLAIGKEMARLGSLTLVWQLVKEKENSKFKPVKFCLSIDFVSHPTQVEVLGMYIYACVWSELKYIKSEDIFTKTGMKNKWNSFSFNSSEFSFGQSTS